MLQRRRHVLLLALLAACGPALAQGAEGPDPPGALRCRTTEEGHLLEWAASEGATHYHVYRALDAPDPAYLATTNGTRYLDATAGDASSVRYWVSAADADAQSTLVGCRGRAVGWLPLAAGVGIAVGGAAGAFLLARPRAAVS